MDSHRIYPLVAALSIVGVVPIAVFASLCLESLPLASIVVPGTAIATAAGSVVGFHFEEFWDLFWIAWFAAVTGSCISYELGRHGAKVRLEDLNQPAFRRNQLSTLRSSVRNRRLQSILLSRFRRETRAGIPYAAGREATRRLAFYPASLLSITVSAFVYLGFGYGVGAALGVAVLWSTPAVLLVLLVVVGLFAVAWLTRWITHNWPTLSEILRSLGCSLAQGIVENTYVRRLISQHPKLSSFLASRFSRCDFQGLPLTTLVTLAFLLLLLLSGLIEDYLRQDPLIAMDTRLAHLLIRFRETHLVAAFYWVTLMGGGLTVGVSAVFALLVLTRRKDWSHATGLAVNLAVATGVVTAAKQVFHRSRPESLLPVVSSGSYSFPSGHATMTAALYAYLAYLVVRLRPSIQEKVFAVVVSLVVIVLVDLSRLYLGVHYLSDVLTGNVVGLLAALTGIAFCEWRQSQSSGASRTLPSSYCPGLLVAVAATASIQAYIVPPPPLTASRQETARYVNLASVPDLFSQGALPCFTESIIGVPQEPISLIVIARDDQCLTTAFAQAGWKKAGPLTFGSYWRAWRMAALRKPYPTAPMSPSFYDAQPHLLGFEKPTERNSIEQRHHVRIWKTGCITQSGNLYVGTASFDVGFKWGLVHQIAPDIDTERDVVVRDLQRAGVVAKAEVLQLVPPTLGENFTRSPYFTYGKAVLITLKAVPSE